MKHIHSAPLALAIALLAVGAFTALNTAALITLAIVGYVIHRAHHSNVQNSDLLEEFIHEANEKAETAIVAASTLKAECEELAAKLADVERIARSAETHANQVDQKVAAKAFIR